ncbi:hypothetical protein vseg_016621 [Gypsophila vaccaria]
MSSPPSPPQQPPPPPPPPPSRISDLQIDFITAEILPKLPAKTLLRFKTVCKYFNTLISSPEFIRRHLRHSLSSDHRLLAVPATYRTLHTFDLDSLSSAPSAASAAFYWPDDSPCVAVVGACNGLLLISGSNRRLVVLNPSTRAYVDVPSAANKSLGFGFDHRNDDYKIVILFDSHNNAIRSRTTKIYSLRSKTCNLVDRTFPSDSLEERNGGVLIGDHLLHWMFWCPSKRKRRIGCFDVCLEKWKDDVLLPSYYYDPNHKNYLLDFGVVDGILFSSFENRDDLSYEVWVMKEYGVEESWTKLLSVPISDELKGGVVPVACRVGESRTQVLIKQRHVSRLFLYNKVDGVVSKVNVRYRSGLQPYVFKGSLVSLPGAKFLGDVYEPPV